MKKFCLLAYFLLGVGAELDNNIPSYISVCYRDDPDVDSCLLESSKKVLPHIVNGDPSLNIPPLDPLLVEHLKVHHGDDKFGLTIDIKDANVYGLSTSKITKVSVDTKTLSGLLHMKVPKITILTDYKVGGQVLILPIKGIGRANFTMTDVAVKYISPFELKVRADGKAHAHLFNSTLHFDMSRLYIHLENLFDGNKLLGDAMNLFLNQNWKELLTVMKPTLTETLQILSLNMINAIGSAISYDDAFPPTRQLHQDSH